MDKNLTQAELVDIMSDITVTLDEVMHHTDQKMWDATKFGLIHFVMHDLNMQEAAECLREAKDCGDFKKLIPNEE